MDNNTNKIDEVLPNGEETQIELTSEEYSELVTIRRDKLKALKDEGHDPFENTK